eukprot:GHVS01059687.1.p1 GENE.GHVS01059687.1~~GHVS01059687.1.p1  ORF type:complete len:375 (+),score=30.25 GHVS01059687.1:2034-3158(+)
MAAATEVRHAFLVEWWDTQAELVRQYNLIFYPVDKTLEMWDLRTRRLFLKRCRFPVDEKELCIGAVVTVYSRQLKIVDFADSYTRTHFNKVQRSALLMVPVSALDHLGKTLSILQQHDILLTQIKSCNRLDKAVVEKLLRGYDAICSLPEKSLIDELSARPCVCMEIVWKQEVEAQNELQDLSVNHVILDVSMADCRQTVEDLFTAHMKTAASFGASENSTCGIIRPHALKSAGLIIDQICESGFSINSIQLQRLDNAEAEHFLEVYKTAVPGYSQMVDDLCSGSCIALEVCSSRDDTVQAFRELCGPHDPEIAKHLRPKSIRAMYGDTRVQNAIHCSDLLDDGKLEVEYLFSLLASKPETVGSCAASRTNCPN